MTDDAPTPPPGESGQPVPAASLPPGQADKGRLAESRKLDFIDTLRGLAILMVIAVHHGQQFHDLSPIAFVTGYGQMGVQLFFIASAFTMCLSMTSRRTEPHPVSSFFIRRFFRIAPLYYLGIPLYFCVDLVRRQLGTVDEPSLYTLTNILANLTFVHGFVPSAYNNVVLGGWSIAAEANFYLLFPLLFLICRLLHERFGMAPLLVLAVLSLAGNMFVQLLVIELTTTSILNNNFFYCNIANQLPVFLIGMCAYFRVAVDKRFDPRAPRDWTGFILLTFVAVFLLYWITPLSAMLLPAVAALSFVFLLNIVRTRSFGIGLIERIGQVSYSMYIFHFLFALYLTSFLLRLASGLPYHGALLYLPTLALTVFASYAVGRLSKVYIEDIFIAVGRRWIAARDRRHFGRRPAAAD